MLNPRCAPLGAQLLCNGREIVALGWRGPSELRYWDAGGGGGLDYVTVEPNDDRFDYVKDTEYGFEELQERLDALIHLKHIPEHAHTQRLVEMTIKQALSVHEKVSNINHDRMQQAGTIGDFRRKETAASMVMEHMKNRMHVVKQDLIAMVRVEGPDAEAKMRELAERSLRMIEDHEATGPELPEDFPTAHRALVAVCQAIVEYLHDTTMTAFDLEGWSDEWRRWAEAEEDAPVVISLDPPRTATPQNP